MLQDSPNTISQQHAEGMKDSSERRVHMGTMGAVESRVSGRTTHPGEMSVHLRRDRQTGGAVILGAGGV